MSTPKPPRVKWKVAPPLTGKYRMFDKRGWPMAHLDDAHGSLVAFLRCEDSYAPRAARYGEHRPLTLYVAFRHGVPDGGYKWVQWSKPQTLAEAKAVVAQWVSKHPEHLPKEEHHEH